MNFTSDDSDLEIIASRLEADDFKVKDLVAHFGVRRVTIVRRLASGDLPTPTTDFLGHYHWTREQVAEIELSKVLVPRNTAETGLFPCGTHAAYARHKKHNEPVDLLCRLAYRRYERERKRELKERQMSGGRKCETEECGQMIPWTAHTQKRFCEVCVREKELERMRRRRSRNRTAPPPPPASAPRTAPDLSWMEQAACKGMDPALFHPDNEKDEAAPKAICAVCPVREDCLEYAIDEPDGIWGGMTEPERRRYKKRVA